MTSATLPSHLTRVLRPDLVEVLGRIKPGDRMRVTQLVRVGLTSWPAVATGTFRHVDSLATGLATQRVPQDDIIVGIVHFVKEPHGELSSVALDEHTRIEIL